MKIGSNYRKIRIIEVRIIESLLYINTLATETVRLELVGVKSQLPLPQPNVNKVDEENSLVDAIANEVIDKIENLSLEGNQISKGQNR